MKNDTVKTRNAVIMAAGTASRFAPISYEKPKGLIEVRGEVLIERQIRQLREAGVEEIVIVTGYQAEKFAYLKDKYDVTLVHNPDYLTRNNNASIKVAEPYIQNTLICSSDNYFPENPFMDTETVGYYAAVYSEGPTNEWCLTEDENGYISEVKIGGSDAWYMLGHVFWDSTFSSRFLQILNEEYDLPGTADLLWESIYMKHLDELKLKIRKYRSDFIFEFDTLDELRLFDPSYVNDTHSEILAEIAGDLSCEQKDMHSFQTIKCSDNAAMGFRFVLNENIYAYYYENKKLIMER